MTPAPKKESSKRILLVDDNSSGLLARRSVLAELGYEIVTSSSPQEALVLCSTQLFHLVVTDYRMPTMNGIDFISHLRRHKHTMPVILISGYTDTLGFTEKNTGADAVIQKSANEVQHLTRSVNGLLYPRKPPGSVEWPKRPKRNKKE
jgi:CheY-like chemotaxis protein